MDMKNIHFRGTPLRLDGTVNLAVASAEKTPIVLHKIDAGKITAKSKKTKEDASFKVA